MIFIRSRDGTRIAVYDLNPLGKKTVLLVHGWPLSHKMYEYQIEPLICAGYRVVLLDLRGFGNSDAPTCGYGYDQMAADLYMVVRALGLCHFILVGFSMGGAIVLRYMRCFRGFGVSKLILLAAAAPKWTQCEGYPHGLTVDEVNSLICLAKTDRPQLSENFSKQLFASPQSESAVQWFKNIALSASGIGTVRAALSLRDEDGRKDLTCVRVPTRIMQGQKDIIVSPDLSRLQRNGIAGAKLYMLKNSGHGIVYDELQSFNRCFMKVIEY